MWDFALRPVFVPTTNLDIADLICSQACIIQIGIWAKLVSNLVASGPLNSKISFKMSCVTCHAVREIVNFHDLEALKISCVWYQNVQYTIIFDSKTIS